MNKNIISTILIILAIGVYLTVTKGLWNDTDAIRATNAQYEAALASATQLIKLRDQVMSNFQSISSDDKDRLSKMIPSSVDNIRLMIDMNSLAQREGLVLKNISINANGQTQSAVVNNNQPSVTGGQSNNIPAPVLDTVAVSFGVTAPFQQFMTLMRDMEADLRIADLTHLSVTASDTGTYDFSVGLTMYWLRQQ